MGCQPPVPDRRGCGRGAFRPRTAASLDRIPTSRTVTGWKPDSRGLPDTRRGHAFRSHHFAALAFAEGSAEARAGTAPPVGRVQLFSDPTDPSSGGNSPFKSDAGGNDTSLNSRSEHRRRNAQVLK
ncbi:MAG: hypothetical protein AMXMBFR83_12050 [Phycisphaerae bacterium]